MHHTNSKSNKHFYRPLHILRGLAIILIVAAHSWSMAIFFYSDDFSVVPSLKWLNSLTETLFHDGTIIFAFISGLLFSLVLQNKSWRAFYRGKIKNVFAPFLIFTFIYTLIQWQVTFVGFYEIKPDSFTGYLIAVVHNIPTGLASFHLWYIPVLLILFMLTPVVQLLVKNTAYWPLIVILLILPLVASRQWPEFSWLTIIYFLGVYLLGGIVGENYQKSLMLIKQYTSLLLIIFLLTSSCLFLLYQVDFDKIGVVSVRESIFYLQKISLALLLLRLVNVFEHSCPKWIDKLGDHSFAIYFIHPALTILLTEYLKAQGLLSSIPIVVIGIGFSLLMFSIFTSYLLSASIKQIAGKYSRMLVGA